MGVGDVPPRFQIKYTLYQYDSRKKRKRINKERRGGGKGEGKEEKDDKMWRCCVYIHAPLQFFDQQILKLPWYG